MTNTPDREWIMLFMENVEFFQKCQRSDGLPDFAHSPRAFPGPSPRVSGGFTIIETIVGALVVLIALGAIFQVSSRCMSIIASSHSVALASASIHERMQQLQALPWEMLTDSEYFTDQVWTDPEDGTKENYSGLMKNVTQSGAQLASWGAVEWVTISAHRPVASAVAIPSPITVKRTSSSATLTSAASTLVDEKMVRVDLRLTWTDSRLGLPRSLGTSTIVARK
jgi:type II secretory pathway pseudopilin PulG